MEKHELQNEGLSRLVQHNNEYDCAMMSGYLSIPGTTPTRKEQQQRHAKLLSELKMYNFVILSIKGRWPDKKGNIKKEESFFVVNRGRDKSTLSSDEFTKAIVKLGKKLRQFAVMMIPKGALSGKNRAFEIYMSKPTKKEYAGAAELGRATGGMFSRYKGRKFAFKEWTEKSNWEIEGIHFPAESLLHRYSCQRNINRPLEEMSISELDVDAGMKKWITEYKGGLYPIYKTPYAEVED